MRLPRSLAVGCHPHKHGRFLTRLYGEGRHLNFGPDPAYSRRRLPESSYPMPRVIDSSDEEEGGDAVESIKMMLKTAQKLIKQCEQKLAEVDRGAWAIRRVLSVKGDFALVEWEPTMIRRDQITDLID